MTTVVQHHENYQASKSIVKSDSTASTSSLDSSSFCGSPTSSVAFTRKKNDLSDSKIIKNEKVSWKQQEQKKQLPFRPQAQHAFPKRTVLAPIAPTPNTGTTENKAVSSTVQVSSTSQLKTVIPVLVRPAPLKKHVTYSKTSPDAAQNDFQPQVTGYNQTPTAQVPGKINGPIQSRQIEELQKRHFLQQQKQELEEKLKQDNLQYRKKQEAQCNFPVKKFNRNTQLQDQVSVEAMIQTSPQNYSRRANSNNISSSGAAIEQTKMKSHNQKNVISNHNQLTNNDSLDPSSHLPTPLFERLVTEDIQDIKAYIKFVEQSNRRVAEMEHIHDELESRLEQSTLEKLELEKKVEGLNQKWAEKCYNLEKERDSWASRCAAERGRNERLGELINRKDKEIHRMIQRKYDSKNQAHSHSHLKRSESARAASSSSPQVNPSSFSNLSNVNSTAIQKKKINYSQGKSPHEILVEKGCVDAVRERNVVHSLLDFFGM